MMDTCFDSETGKREWEEHQECGSVATIKLQESSGVRKF